MPDTDPRAAAIEAAEWTFAEGKDCPHGEPAPCYECQRLARRAVAAAVPHLTAGLRALHYRDSSEEPPDEWCAECGTDWPCETTQALDALERGGPDA